MKKPEKRKLMEKMFDLTIFSRMNEICNEKLRNIQGKTRETELKIESHLNQIEEAKEMIEKFKDEIKKKAVIEKELADMLLEFKELVDDHPGIEEDIEDLSKKIEEKEKALSNQIQKIDQKLTEIKVKIENLEDDLEESQKLEGIVKRNDELEKDIKKIEKEYGVPEQISNKMDSLKDQKKDKVEGRKKYVDLYEKIEKEMIEFNADLKNLEKNLELLKEGICPVCNTKVKDPKAHYGKEIAGIKRKITTRTKKIKPFVQDIDMLDLGIKDIDNELEILQEFKDGILELKSKIQKVTKKDTSELKEEILKHSDNVEKLYKMKAELKKKTVEEVSPLHNKWNDLKDEFSIIKRKEREVEELQTKVGVEQKNIKSFEKMIEDQEVKIDEINSQSAGLAESMQKFQTLKDYVNAIKGLLKDEKIKQHMISKIMPYLNQQANYYLSEVDYSFYVKIDKWLDIDIRGPGISNATYDSLSGGERRGIDLAIQLGFLDIARTQSGIFPDLLIFDELLDSSIDAQGIVEVLKIVRVKQNEANGKFFIISHRSEIDNDLIDHRYHVIKENGYSRIEI
jgi:DNA repair exonuclease SbcCD ATPase subunit